MSEATNKSIYKPVTVVFTQDGEHIHSWETGMARLNPLDMLEAACCSGLVDEEKPLSYIVYDDDNDDDEKAVLFDGHFRPNFIQNP